MEETDNFDVLHSAREDLNRRQFDARLSQTDLKARQIDLNTVTDLAEHDLEDAALQSHMERARERIKDYWRQQDELPTAESLDELDSDIRKSLSAIVLEFDHHRSWLQLANDAVLIQSSNATKLATGAKPHGYPPLEYTEQSVIACFTHLSSKLKLASETVSSSFARFAEIERKLILMRRNYEVCVDGEKRRSKHFQDLAEHYKNLSSHFEHNKS